MTNVESALLPTLTDPVIIMDQRKHPRHLCIQGGVIRLSVRPEFRGRRALLMDVSSSGIGILLEEALEVDSMLVFELKSADGAEAVGRVARVRRSQSHATPPDAPWLPPTPMLSNVFRRMFGRSQTPLLEPAWLVGCEFERPLDDHELKQLLQILHGDRG